MGSEIKTGKRNEGGLRSRSVLDKKLDKEGDTARVPEKGALIRPEGEERVHRYGQNGRTRILEKQHLLHGQTRHGNRLQYSLRF